MQFHLNGFRTGDPAFSEVIDKKILHDKPIPQDVDVLIVGCGPAGLTLATQLAAFAGIKTAIVDQKPGPLELGQADGIACRTLEMFEAFGFAEKVLKESYWVNETSFWVPDASRRGNIVRNSRVQDVEDDLSEMPHVILNQARVHDFYLEIMRNSASRLEPNYSRRLIDLHIDTSPRPGSHPVTAVLERVDEAGQGHVQSINARYVVGCDGARSAVRKLIGRELKGDSANQAWGVMDILGVTDFPDIRLKCVIQSADHGSIVLIPREGGYLVRIYVELDELAQDERVGNRNMTVDYLIDAARKVLHPYTLDVREVAWWSVYEIGQRLCDKFDDVPEEQTNTRLPRVFIAGDACHTHSPKAGQGMNVSMQDAFNLGWKLAAVLEGRSPPDLLQTYSAERQAIAKELIEFDREWAHMLSAPLKTASNPAGIEPEEVQEYFVRSGRYTAGTASRYDYSTLTAAGSHQSLAHGFQLGTRFHSAPVIRLGDAKVMQIGHAAKADGRWRLYVFAGEGDSAQAGSPVAALCEFLIGATTSPLNVHTRTGADIDSVIDIRAVFQLPHRQLSIQAMPPLLLPAKGLLGLRDYEKVFCAIQGNLHIYSLRGIDRIVGCMVVVRPDQFVGAVLPLDACSELTDYFSRLLIGQADATDSSQASS